MSLNELLKARADAKSNLDKAVVALEKASRAKRETEEQVERFITDPQQVMALLSRLGFSNCRVVGVGNGGRLHIAVVKGKTAWIVELQRDDSKSGFSSACGCCMHMEAAHAQSMKHLFEQGVRRIVAHSPRDYALHAFRDQKTQDFKAPDFDIELCGPSSLPREERLPCTDDPWNWSVDSSLLSPDSRMMLSDILRK